MLDAHDDRLADPIVPGLPLRIPEGRQVREQPGQHDQPGEPSDQDPSDQLA
jgi:hypothetical protein